MGTVNDLEKFAMSRRSIGKAALGALVSSLFVSSEAGADGQDQSLRAVNIMNFLRGAEPRGVMDLFEPLKQQMSIIKEYKFPATWLLQYDAMVSGPFVSYLKAEMPDSHEVGLWLEMNKPLCDDAGVEWRGKTGWTWDYHVPVAYTIGYTHDERISLADTAVSRFEQIFGGKPKTIACWNLDAFTMAHLADVHGVDFFGLCCDQRSTDGYTIWGAPISAYYPSRTNSWSPAVSAKNQIDVPTFRLLGRDPVYSYDNLSADPDTMELVWATGRNPTFVRSFLDMVAFGPSKALSYVQLGQENSFGWEQMKDALPMQMQALSKVANSRSLKIETMGETGRRFKSHFKSTPPQAQVMLNDPFGKGGGDEKTIWYQTKNYRINIHFRGETFYIRDLHVYSDQFQQPFLRSTAQEHGIDQCLPAVMDGYHWSDDEVRAGREGLRAGGEFCLLSPDGKSDRLTTTSEIDVREFAEGMLSKIFLKAGGYLLCRFTEYEVAFSVVGNETAANLGLRFNWAPGAGTFKKISKHRLVYKYRDFDYSIGFDGDGARLLENGVEIISNGRAFININMKNINYI